MLNEIYNKRILELAADIPRIGRLADAGRDGDGAFQAVRLDGDGRPYDRMATWSPTSPMR